jgi:uroporphyrinogen-III decarboxylase
LHKGADGFMNEAQFKKFYWPTLKKVFMGLINEGCVPFPWAEGGYNSRLEIIKDMPKGTMLWGFDATDMTKAKKALGDVSCIGGNVPMSLLQIASANEVTKYCKQLDQTAGKGGGFILMNGAAIDEVKPENLHAMIGKISGQIQNSKLERVTWRSPSFWVFCFDLTARSTCRAR